MASTIVGPEQHPPRGEFENYLVRDRQLQRELNRIQNEIWRVKWLRLWEYHQATAPCWSGWKQPGSTPWEAGIE